MKNIIDFNLDVSKIDLSIRKYFYIHDDLLTTAINSVSDREDLIKIINKDIDIQPFWEDELMKTGDEELDSMINLELIELKAYLNNNPEFWILVREQVFQKLKEVNNYFIEQWYFLSLKVGYRPLVIQKRLFEKIEKLLLKKNPSMSTEELYECTTQFVADPARENYNPPHSTGGAVDLVLFYKDWKKVDMWSVVNYPDEISSLTTDKIDKQAMENREFLTNTMIKFGFANLASEWWHFSYGDAYWAKFYGKKEALYGRVV